MDDFGVLVESIGFKAHGRSSAPLADLKSKNSNRNPGNFGANSGFGFDAKPSSVSSVDLDGIFQSNTGSRNHGGFDVFDDVFGGGGMMKNSNPWNSNSSWNANGGGGDDDDIFGLKSGASAAGVAKNDDDLFGFRVPPPPPRQMRDAPPVDDLLGNFGSKSSVSRENSGNVAKNAAGFDDLIPGFGGSSPSKNGENSEASWPRKSSGHSAKATSNSAEDPFVVFETSSSRSSSSSGLFSDSFQEDTGKNSSTIGELEDFAMGGVRTNTNQQPDFLFADVEGYGDSRSKKASNEKGSQQRRARGSEDDLESFFSKGAQQTNKPRPSVPTVDPMFDVLFQNRGPKVQQTSSATYSSTKKAPSVTNITDDFSFMFGAAPPSEVFQELEGESDDRRRARLNHHLRTQARVAKALADKNERDFQTQQEQEERHRLSETLDDDIKRWAAGKEGNLRALLSSLQNVLWTECGWHPVSLTDLITSVSVKKVYFKATLCVHPDKVQQKGATIRQKYIAEKVFDLLKEAWNKFNSEEL